MDPVTLSVIAGAGAAAYLASKQAPTAPPRTPACDAAKALQGTASGAVTGAVAGSAAPGVGTAAGAGIGAALAATSALAGPCGKDLVRGASKAIHQIGQTTCQKADDLLREAKKHGIAAPLGWNHMSCDQRIAALTAALTPLGIVIAGGVMVVSAGAAAVGRTVDNVTSTTTKAGGGHVTVGGHKIF